MSGEHAVGPRERATDAQRARDAAGIRPTRHRQQFSAMSTSLLNDLLANPLDKGYAEAAHRRAERGDSAAARPGHGRAAQVLLAIGLLLVGLLLAAAYRTTTQQAPASERARQALLRDVELGTARSDQLQRQAEELSARLVAERDAALTASEAGDEVAEQVRRLEGAAAQVPVRGPGVVVEFGDAAPSEQLDPTTGDPQTVPPGDSGRLRDRDLQSVVNGLWTAGAEAVSIDGKRLAPTTTIRAAGEAILVDLVPVSSPYTIEAIGDPDTLLPRFADSDAARRYQSYVGLYGIRFTVGQAADLRLRAATDAELRYAEPLPGTLALPPGDTGSTGGPSGSSTESPPRPGTPGPGSGGPSAGGGP